MHTYCMEGLWSRFLPANRQAKQWIDEGKIGKLTSSHMGAGFVAPNDPNNRYLNPKLGGGAAFDLTVYGHGISTMMYDDEYDRENVQVSASWGETGVDVTDHVVLHYPDAIATFTTTFVGPIEERLVLYGTKGRIVIPNAHFASECYLYNEKQEEVAHFKDTETQNGFVYQIKELIRCVKAGEIETPIVPHSLTIECSRIYDKIMATKP